MSASVEVSPVISPGGDNRPAVPAGFQDVPVVLGTDRLGMLLHFIRVSCPERENIQHIEAVESE